LDKVMPKNEYCPYVHSLMHNSMYVIKTKASKYVFSRELFPIADEDNLPENFKFATLREGNVYNDNNIIVGRGLNSNFNVRLMCYFGPIILESGNKSLENCIVYIDCDREGSYSSRRLFMYSLGCKRYTWGETYRDDRQLWYQKLLSVSALNNVLLDSRELLDDQIVELKYSVMFSDILGPDTRKGVIDDLFVTVESVHEYSEIEKEFVGTIVVKGIAYNPLRKALVFDSSKKGYLVPNVSYTNGININKFSSDVAFPLFLHLDCGEHGDDVRKCDYDNYQCKPRLKLSSIRLSLYDIQLYVYFKEFSYAVDTEAFVSISLDYDMEDDYEYE